MTYVSRLRKRRKQMCFVASAIPNPYLGTNSLSVKYSLKEVLITMVKLSSTVVLALVAGASAFAPQASVPIRSDVSLDMANGSKRKALMKVSLDWF